MKNVILNNKTGIYKNGGYTGTRRWGYAGHIQRYPEERMVKFLYEAEYGGAAAEQLPLGRPKADWLDQIDELFCEAKIHHEQQGAFGWTIRIGQGN